MKTLRCFFAVSFTLYRQKCVSAAARRREAGDCSLLADADALGVQHIQDAVALLKSKGWRVTTSIFAAPQRIQNKKWQALMNEDDIQFKPVERQGGFADTTDEAIATEMRRLMALKGNCSALGLLLHGDGDFVDLIQDVLAANRQVIVIILDTGHNMSVEAYKKTAAQVLLLPVQRDPCKVRATLLPSGKDKVQICDGGFDDVCSQGEIDRVCDVLMNLGYYTANSYLATCIAKCWFESLLGPLCVYPRNLTMEAFIQHLSKNKHGTPKKQQKRMCFVLPLYGPGRPKGYKVKYGSTYAGNVWHGGGPFMLHDGADLPIRVLTRLGYLDKWNTDVAEAFFVFCSCSCNKRLLRKLLLLPEGGDEWGELSTKLRQAFLSSDTPGTWQLGPKDTSVRSLLRKEGFLQIKRASKYEVLQAMKKFAARNGLQLMKNYDSYVSRILTVLNGKDPSRREVLDGPF